MRRAAAVAGRFYPGDPDRLGEQVRGFMGAAPGDPALVTIGPHAGYIYSGAILGETYAAVAVSDTVVVLCPNHTGLGAARSCWTRGAWELPGGDVAIDSELAPSLLQALDLEPDHGAHLREHAIEVHLPFLRARNPAVKIVPIVLHRHDAGACVQMGEALADVLAERTDVLVSASTDMSHYISAAQAETLDALAIARVVDVDPEGLHACVERNRITMCGYVPTTVALAYARKRGAQSARLVRYGNSGERSGDFERVVGYAGFVVR